MTVNALGVALTPLCKSFTLRLGLKPTSAILFPLASQNLGAAWARVADQWAFPSTVDPFYPSNLYPTSPSLREKPSSPLCIPLGIFHRWSQVSPATRASVWPAGLCTVPEPSHPRPQPASWKAWCYRHEDNGPAGLKAFQSPTFSRKGCVVERKGHSCQWFMFSQASIPRKQLCLYKTRREGERERKDSVLGMTSFCLVCFTSPTVGKRGGGGWGESCGRLVDVLGASARSVSACMCLLDI